MGANNPGSYPCTLEAKMKAFDKLPRSVRHAIANAHDDWVPQPLLTRFRRGVSAAMLVKRIAWWNTQEERKAMERLLRRIDQTGGKAKRRR
jgi:hypothetical protein